MGLRVGLSGGEVSREDDDYFGDPVIEAARLCARCESGQVLAADIVRLTAGRRSRHECRSLGELTLKGLPEPVETVEVVWQLHTEVLPPRARPRAARPNARAAHYAAPSVPTPSSSFIGRGDLVRRVVDRLQEQRLVTLIGPGGVGKTHVARSKSAATWKKRARASGSASSPRHPSKPWRSWFAETVGVEERAGVSLRDRITEVLGPDHGLLVLDNCEHVLDAAAGLAEAVLRRCADVRILVTSRERLAVEGEHLAPVTPFTVADTCRRLTPR